MNFFKVIFFNIIITFSYAKIIKVLKRNVNLDENSLINSISKECIEEQEKSEYKDCISEITISNYKNVCSKINSDKCQKFYNNPLEFYPICREISNFAEMFQPSLIKSLKLSYQMSCQTDENGNLCPFALTLIRRERNSNILNDTCKSKLCTESAINTYKNYDLEQMAAYENLSSTTGNYSYDELTMTKKLLSELESEKCQSQHISSAVTIAKSNIHIVFLLVLLLLVFY